MYREQVPQGKGLGMCSERRKRGAVPLHFPGHQKAKGEWGDPQNKTAPNSGKKRGKNWAGNLGEKLKLWPEGCWRESLTALWAQRGQVSKEPD